MLIRPFFVTLLCAGTVATHAQQTRTQFGPPLVIGNGEIIAAQPLYTASSAALRVFRHQDRGWDLAAVHVVDGVGPEDDFASAMDLDRSVLAVGARSADDNRGAVYLFVRDAASGEWLQRDRLAINDGNARLGSALDLYGNVLVAGAPGIDAVLVVHNVGSDAQSVERLFATDQAAGIRFGEAVAYDGERIFVGAPGHDSKSGAVYVFRRTDAGFRQEALLTAPDYRGFGKALIAFAPGVVLATAPGLSIQERIDAGEQDLSYDGPPASGPIFELGTDASGDWTQRIVVDSLRDRGLQLSAEIPMAADGARLFIGLPSGERKLQVYTRGVESSSWPLTSEIENLNDEIGLGSSLASDGKHVAVMAPGISYEQVAIVLFSITTDGLERTDRIT